MTKQNVLHLIANNKTAEALKRLTAYLPSGEQQREIILLASRFSGLNDDARSGIISRDVLSSETNKINKAILQLIEDIDFLPNNLPMEYEEEEDYSSDYEDDDAYSNSNERLYLPINNTDKSFSFPFGWLIFFALLAGAVYYFYFMPEPPPTPIDCNNSFSLRNNSSIIETSSERFDDLGYRDMDCFSVSFGKCKTDSLNNIWTNIFIEMPKTNEFSVVINDTISNDFIQFCKLNTPNLHIEFEGGGETYLSTKYSVFYSLKNSHHIHFESDTLSKDIVNKIIENKIQSVSLFNAAFNLSPQFTLTSLFTKDKNQIRMQKLSQHLKCLVEYK